MVTLIFENRLIKSRLDKKKYLDEPTGNFNVADIYVTLKEQDKKQKGIAPRYGKYIGH